MKYIWVLQTAAVSPVTLSPPLLAEIQTHQTPWKKNKLPLAITALAIMLTRDSSYDDHVGLELS